MPVTSSELARLQLLKSHLPELVLGRDPADGELFVHCDLTLTGYERSLVAAAGAAWDDVERCTHKLRAVALRISSGMDAGAAAAPFLPF